MCTHVGYVAVNRSKGNKKKWLCSLQNSIQTKQNVSREEKN